MPAPQEEAERVHARDVLFLAAYGGSGPQGAGADLPHDERGDPVALRLRLSALGLRPAVNDLRPALCLRARQAQYSRRHRGALVPAQAAQREAEGEPGEVRQSCRLTRRAEFATGTMPGRKPGISFRERYGSG